MAGFSIEGFSCDVREGTDARSPKKFRPVWYKKLSESSWEKDNGQNFNTYAEVSISMFEEL